MIFFTIWKASVPAIRIRNLRIISLSMAMLLITLSVSSKEVNMTKTRYLVNYFNTIPQQATGSIKGKVTDSKGITLPGVTVKIDGNIPQEQASDGDGNYSITNLRAGNYTLTFTFVGFTTVINKVTLATGQQSVINVSLNEENTSLDEVVIVGYGEQKRSEITGAIASVGREISSVPAGGIQEALQGRVAGINITPTSGQPGGAIDMNVRGVATFGAGNPLFVVDGVPIMSEGSSRNFNPLASINPDDIVSMDILKDASAAAIYGARAANGVVIVTTNRGKSGENRLQFKVSEGVSTVTHFLPMMSTAEWIPYSTEAYKNAGNAIPVAFVEPLLSQNLLTNTNWQKEGFSPALRQNYWLGISGGSENANYSFSTGFLDEDGTLPQSRFRRASINLNSDFKFRERIKIGETIGFSGNIWNGTFAQASSPMRQLNQQAPTVPVYNPSAVGGFDGPRLKYGPVGRANTIADFTLFENSNTQNKVTGNSYAEIQLIPGLSNRFAVGGEITLGRTFSYTPLYDEGDRVNTLGLLSEGRNDENSFLIENITTYKKVFNDIHSLTALVGVTQQKSWARSTSVQLRTFPSDDLRTVAAGFEQRNIGGNETGWRLRSQIGRLNYSYNSRYNLMAVVRRDGSSRFGINNRYGERYFTPAVPCEASELVHFRNRIGAEGVEMILKESIRVNGKAGREDKGSVDTTVQEKNITYPTDNKLHRKIISKCIAIAEKEGLELRQSYRRTLKRLGVDQRFRNHPKNGKKARKADRKVKTIAGRLVRELERKLPAPLGGYATELALFHQVLNQKRKDTNKVYSLHEPDVACISKGKEHKKYEFGSKVSITVTRNSGVIIGAVNIPKNDYDGHTLEAALEQQQRLTGHVLKEVAVDRGCRGISQVRGTQIHTPRPFAKKLTAYQKVKRKKGFSRRAAIEPKISHLKADHRLSRNFYKGITGDDINVMLAAAAMNFKRMMNIWKHRFLALLFRLFHILISQQKSIKLNSEILYLTF